MVANLQERIKILEQLNQIRQRKNEQDDFLLFCKRSCNIISLVGFMLIFAED